MHLEFYKKYYKYYNELEIAYLPDWVLNEDRLRRMKINYVNMFFNDAYKDDSVCLFEKSGKKKYYKQFKNMTRKELIQYQEDYLSGE